MRGNVPTYQLITPASLNEALTLLSNEPGVWKPFAGGTDLMVLFESGRLQHRNYINIWSLSELREISVDETHVTLGALTTYTDVQESSVLQSEFPMLCQAASETGGLAIQNRGTLGGNIVNASPAADSPPALLAYDAEIELTSVNESRWIPYQGFHSGYKKMQMRPDELLTRIRLTRRHNNLLYYYRKVGTRKAQAISKVCIAAVGGRQNEQVNHVRLVFGSVAPIVIRCTATENFLLNKSLDDATLNGASESLRKEIAPIDDIRSTAAYRLRVATNLLSDFLLSLRVH